MALMPMYPGQPNSPQTELAENIDETQTTIPLLDASVLPPPPNLAVIGGGEHAETVLYESIDGDNLINCTRGFQGVASSWQAGQKVARNFTAYDYDALRQNLRNHGSEHNHDGADPIPDLVQLRELGLGIDVDPRISSDLNNETQTGWVRFETGETLNRPSDEIPDFPHSGVVRVDRRHADRLAQTAYGVAGGTSVRIAVRALGSAGWGNWVEVLHTGNTTSIVNQDYETGTWTPALEGLDVPGNHTYSVLRGNYHIIGDRIFVSGELRITSSGFDSNMSGGIVISGLPFAQRNSINDSTTFVIGPRTGIDSAKPVYGYIYREENVLSLLSGWTSDRVRITHEDLSTPIHISFSGHYRI